MKKGFTLAEVLITMGIIGIIAAFTIPNLIRNYKKVVIETTLKKFYTVMNQALTANIAKYGDYSNWNDAGGILSYGAIKASPSLSDQDFVEKYLTPHLEIVKMENKIHSGIANYPLVTCTLQDGLTFAMYDGGAFYYVFTDNSPNKALGKNAFEFLFVPRIKSGYEHLWKAHQNKGIEPFGYTQGQNGLTINNYYINNCKNGGSTCAKLIQMNNWKIPKAYPIKF